MKRTVTYPTITIGIPVYNEQQTIEKTLISLVNQTGRFTLEKILVIADGTTDDTKKIVKRLQKKYPVIQLQADSKKLGKARRLNQLFKNNTSDIVMIVDGDILILDTYLLDRLSRPFSHKKVGLVSANTQYLATTWFGKITAASERLWYEARKNANGGNNFFNNTGSTVALSKEFAASIQLPPTSVDDQHWIYYLCIKNNFKFVFLPDALSFSLSPATFSDVMKYQARSAKKTDEEEDIADQLGSLAIIDKKNEVKALLQRLIKDPIFTVSAVLYMAMLKVLPVAMDPLTLSGRWERLSSTKQAFTPELIEQAQQITQEILCK